MTAEQFEALIELIEAIAEQARDDPYYEYPGNVRRVTERVRGILVAEPPK